jgi:nitrate reductase gamma subunit
LMLLLLLGIGVTGVLTTFVAHTDVVAVKSFFRHLMTFNFETMPNVPTDPLMVVHLLLVGVLMIIFPISKLLHAPGVFFSPSRNQVDNPREQRHVSDWAKKLEN